MFLNCYYLRAVPVIDTSKGTNFTAMFYNNYRLQVLPALNMESGTTTTTTFYRLYSLTWSDVTGVSGTHTYLDSSLSAEALDNIYTNLPNVTGQTITVTGNPGVTGDDPTIATDKGWTVTG